MITKNNMNISIYQKEVFQNYKNNSQIARVLTEQWFSKEMYCPSCLNEKVLKLPNNSKVLDFLCEKCKNKYELKSSNKKFGKKINDGEYNTMTKTIVENRTPNFFILQYSNQDWAVKNLFAIPNFFISDSVIEKRKPLSPDARRAGWTGCNILLNRIPEDGRIQIIKNEKIIDKESVNKSWNKMIFLNKKNPDFRGWTSDVLKCVRDLKDKKFKLNEVYKFKDYLSELHPENKHIEAKIRQQLQILRDNKIIQFKERGFYEVLQ